MNLINTEIQSIEDKIIELQNKGEDVTTLINNLTNFKIALENINNKIYRIFSVTADDEGPLMDILRQNHKEHDTKFIFVDETEYTVKKDDLCSMQDNFLLIHNKSEYEEDKTIVPGMDHVLNLDNVLWVSTLRPE